MSSHILRNYANERLCISNNYTYPRCVVFVRICTSCCVINLGASFLAPVSALLGYPRDIIRMINRLWSSFIGTMITK